jgi:hypothetical protein
MFRWEDRGEAEVALVGNTSLTFRTGESDGQRSVGERGLLVAGPAPHSRKALEDDALA